MKTRKKLKLKLKLKKIKKKEKEPWDASDAGFEMLSLREAKDKKRKKVNCWTNWTQ